MANDGVVAWLIQNTQNCILLGIPQSFMWLRGTINCFKLLRILLLKAISDFTFKHYSKLSGGREVHFVLQNTVTFKIKARAVNLLDTRMEYIIGNGYNTAVFSVFCTLKRYFLGKGQ